LTLLKVLELDWVKKLLLEFAPIIASIIAPIIAPIYTDYYIDYGNPWGYAAYLTYITFDYSIAMI